MTRAPGFRRLLAAHAVALGLLGAGDADAQETRERSAAAAANVGLRMDVGPVVLFPTDGGPVGGGLLLDVRYGVELGPTVLAPGGRLSGYVLSERFIGTAMPTLRLTLPVGPLAPFALGGAGGGWLTNPSETGVALLGGGGLMVHFGRVFAVGAEVTYQTIPGSELESVAVGPVIVFGG